jgi:hypothetical protein
MAWLENFLLKRKARRLVPLIAAELVKSYGAAAVYTPGQVTVTAQRLKVPSSLMPMISAGILSEEVFVALFPVEDYRELREGYLALVPLEFDGGTANNTENYYS